MSLAALVLHNSMAGSIQVGAHLEEQLTVVIICNFEHENVGQCNGKQLLQSAIRWQISQYVKVGEGHGLQFLK